MKTERKAKVIFLGNGALADAAEAVLAQHFDLIFHARTRDDLATVRQLKEEQPEAHAILASFGQIIKPDLLELFEPEGILNIHPSLLPKYRGASPIETAILQGDSVLGVSVMKLAPEMDAGPIYYQGAVAVDGTAVGLGNEGDAVRDTAEDVAGVATGVAADAAEALPTVPLDKAVIYRTLAEMGARWLVENLEHLPQPTPQDAKNATYTQKITKNLALIDPTTEAAVTILRKIIAFQGFPKVRFAFYGQNCLLLAAHLLKRGTTAPLTITGADGQILAIDRLQPEGRRPMEARAFLNGYARKASRN